MGSDARCRDLNFGLLLPSCVSWNKSLLPEAQFPYLIIAEAICINSRFPMCLAHGKGYRSVVGRFHGLNPILLLSKSFAINNPLGFLSQDPFRQNPDFPGFYEPN